MAVAAADRAVVTRLERELCDFLATVCAGPVALEHGAVATRAITTTGACWTAGAVTIAALHLLTLAGLERKFRYLLAAVCTLPVTLHHRARAELTIRITEHV
jgi:hypothetical protein